jgi:hypothetical protein
MLKKNNVNTFAYLICDRNFDKCTHRRGCIISGAPRQSSTVYPANNVTNVTSEQHVPSTLTFRALAYPKPSVRWYKKQDTSWLELLTNLSNKILMSSSEDRLEYNLTVLNITQSDYGQYRLDITNSFGQHLQIFNLIPNGIYNVHFIKLASFHCMRIEQLTLVVKYT